MIAEKVTKVATPLVLCDKEGTPFTVRYDAVNQYQAETIVCLESQLLIIHRTRPGCFPSAVYGSVFSFLFLSAQGFRKWAHFVFTLGC